MGPFRLARNRDVIMGLNGLRFPAIYAHRAGGAAAREWYGWDEVWTAEWLPDVVTGVRRSREAGGVCSGVIGPLGRIRVFSPTNYIPVLP